MWSAWTRSKELSVGKRERGVLPGPGTPHEQVSPPSVSNVVVAAGDLQLVSAAGEPMPVVGQANVVV